MRGARVLLDSDLAALSPEDKGGSKESSGPRHPTRWSVNILVSKHQSETEVSRLTITLSETRYKALKEAAVQRDKTIGQLIDESLDFYGIKSREDARDLVRRARARSKLTEHRALAVALEHVRAVRRKS